MSALSEQRKRPSILNELWHTGPELLDALPTFGLPLELFTQLVATTSTTLTTITMAWDTVSTASHPNTKLTKNLYVQRFY